MKYKELVKKASISQTVFERKQEMEKLATVQKYMDYGLSFDTASALVKSSAVTWDAAKDVLDKAIPYVAERAKNLGDLSDQAVKTLENSKKLLGKKENKFTAGHMLGVGAGAAGLAGLAGLSVGMNHSRDKKRMPDYGQE